MKFKSLIKKLYHHTFTLAFYLGFSMDLLFLPSIENVHTKLIGGTYLTIVSLSILIREYIVSRNRADEREAKLFNIFSLIISFFSGTLLSFVFVYSLRSASLSVSWPFFLILFGVMLLNEFFSSQAFRFLIDLSVLLTANTFLFVYALPIVLHRQSDNIFLISIALSILVSVLYINFLKAFSYTVKEVISDAYKIAICLPAVIVTFYFLNIIPPVPLSLKSGDIYHEVARYGDGGFLVTQEDTRKSIINFNRTKVYHFRTNEPAYFFSAIVAPDKLQADLSHVWEKYNEQTKNWDVMLTVPFSLVGGRDNGYRAYSYINNLTEGKWRVSAMVGERRIVGQILFTAVHVDKEVQLIQTKV
jgi:hypothetical protein